MPALPSDPDYIVVSILVVHRMGIGQCIKIRYFWRRIVRVDYTYTLEPLRLIHVSGI